MALTDFTLLDLAAQVRQLGRAVVFHSTPHWDTKTANLTLTHLMDTEGDVIADANDEFSTLALPELTGSIPHEAYYDGSAPQIVIPGYNVAASIRNIVTPTGTAHIGHSRQRPVTYSTVVLFPEQLFYDGTDFSGIRYDTGAGWTDTSDVALSAARLALLDTALWFWRCYWMRPSFEFKHGDGGKAVGEVTLVPCFDSDTQLPDGQHVMTYGEPVAAGVNIEPVAT